MNNKVKITIESPLLRAGLKIETEVSMHFASKATNELLNIVREINALDALNSAGVSMLKS